MEYTEYIRLKKAAEGEIYGEQLRLFKKKLWKKYQHTLKLKQPGKKGRNYRRWAKQFDLEQSEKRNSPKYWNWRKRIFKRDDYTCQRCSKYVKKGKRRGKIEAHHLKHWHTHPKLRFRTDNGITLCIDCHTDQHPWRRKVKGYEHTGGQYNTYGKQDFKVILRKK